MTNLRQTYQNSLERAGVPSALAQRCSYILVRDDASQPNLGRSEEDQATIDESMQHIRHIP